MTVAISVDVEARKLLAKLRRMARGLDAPTRTVLNHKVAIDLKTWIDRNFESEGRLWKPSGWQPLAPSTMAKRAASLRGKGERATVRKLYRQGKTMSEVGRITTARFGRALGQAMILQDTGYMRQSFQTFHDADQAGAGTLRGLRHADISEYHQHGNPARNLPARPMLPSREQAAVIGITVYQLHVKKLAGSA